MTKEEKHWIIDHPTIRVASELDWHPFDYMEYGKPKGLVIDYIRLITEKAGLNIEFVNGYSWAELLELFKKRQIDVMPTLYHNEERAKFTLYTKPYYRAKLGIMVRKDSDLTKSDLYKVKVGIQESNGSIKIVEQRLPQLEMVQVPFNVDLVTQLATKKLDAIIGNPYVFYYHAKEEQISDIKLQGYIDMDSMQQVDTSFHIGVRNDWPILHSILQKAMNDVTEEEFATIEKKWASVRVGETIDWVLIGQIVFVILAVVLFLFWSNRKLKQMVDVKTHELRTLNESLEMRVEERTNELLVMNKELERMANTDPLTNAYNRRYFFDLAVHHMELARRASSTLSVAMIDIDNFKSINDQFGHDVGDQVIKSMVNLATSSIRASDIIARFGGEELVALFPDTNLEGARTLAEKIRSHIEATSPNNLIVYTVSIGVSEFTSEDKKFDRLLKRADEALYLAKRNGRNNVKTSEDLGAA